MSLIRAANLLMLILLIAKALGYITISLWIILIPLWFQIGVGAVVLYAIAKYEGPIG